MNTIKAILLIGLIASTGFGDAAVIKTTVSNGSGATAGLQTAFDGDISSTDLINFGQATFGGLVANSPTASFPVTGSNDGTASQANGREGLTFWNDGNLSHTLTYTLTGSATGYDINSISTIYGWGDGGNRFSEQNYSIEFATVAVPTFTAFDSVLYDPFTANVQGSSKVVWTEDSTNILKSGVTGIRFTINGGNNASQVGVIREIDVFGVATIPEPSSAALFCIAALGLLIRRRR